MARGRERGSGGREGGSGGSDARAASMKRMSVKCHKAFQLERPHWREGGREGCESCFSEEDVCEMP